jgi:putative MFS transporter
MSLLDRLDRIPLSRPHYLLLVMGGLGYTFDGMDAAIVAFLLPSVKTEWGLSAAQLGIIGSATPFGRRSVMLYALIFYCVFTLVAAAAPNYPVFVGARVLAGLGTGAESAIIAPFLAEFVPPARRGWFLGALAGFFSFGFVGAALIGRFVVPLSDSGWRWAQVVTAVPVLMVLWWRRSLPESPRYLLLRGRTAEAEQVVADFERRAEASLGTALPAVPPSAAAPEPIGATAPSSPAGPLAAVRFMWSPPMARRTAVVWVLWFVITFSYYGFFSWIPTLLINRGLTVTTSFPAQPERHLAHHRHQRSAAVVLPQRRVRGPVRLHTGGVPDLGAQHRHRDVQRLRAHRQHHRTDDHGRPPRRSRGRAGVRPLDGRSVAGGAQRAAGAGRGRVARRAVMLAGTTS